MAPYTGYEPVADTQFSCKVDEWHSRQSHKRTFGVPDCVNCAAIPLIKECNTAMSAIRKRVFTLLKNEHTESCEINQLLAYEQPNTYIVVNDEYSADTTLTPVLTANKGFVLGYTDEDFGIYQKGECIIFDDFTMDAKYVSFPFKVKSSAIKILTAKLNVNLRFMFEYLSYLGLKSEEHKRHYISEIASLVIELPSK